MKALLAHWSSILFLPICSLGKDAHNATSDICGHGQNCQPDQGGLLQLKYKKEMEGLVVAVPECFLPRPFNSYYFPCNNSNNWFFTWLQFNDSRCDCPECEDEVDWDCSSCECPTSCDKDASYCVPQDESSSNLLPECEKMKQIDLDWLPENLVPACTSTTGWVIPSFYVEDGDCDCPFCEDETTVTCGECGKCPTVCGSYIQCDLSDQITEIPSEECRVETDAEIGFYPPFFVCDNNWTIPFLYVDDAWCDCPACEDEFDFDCTTCGGCPTVCGEFVDCLVARAQQVFGGECRVGLALYYLELSHYLPFDDLLGTEFRTCSNGWQLPAASWGDDYCDCPGCEDEISRGWTCENCGCPTSCYDSVPCTFDLAYSIDGNKKACQDIFAPSELSDGTFLCNSGWIIPWGYKGDGACDCPDCEDEPAHTCESCGACPLTCGAFMFCDDIQPACSIGDARPHLCASSPGFVIDSDYVGDGDCDCPLCEDEEFTCEDCGACPVICGDYVICDLGASPDLVTFINRSSYIIPANYECLKAGAQYSWYDTFEDFRYCDGPEWYIPSAYWNDGYCDCPSCEDESGTWTCNTCGGCPGTCGDSFLCHPSASHDKLCPLPPGVLSNGTFTCDNGWKIPADRKEDGEYCDCPNCEDEGQWSCASCGACPAGCTVRIKCGPDIFPCELPNPDAFNCTSTPGFQIDERAVANGDCDCPQCEDEATKTCEECGLCPKRCGDTVVCALGFSLNMVYPEETADVLWSMQQVQQPSTCCGKALLVRVEMRCISACLVKS